MSNYNDSYKERLEKLNEDIAKDLLPVVVILGLLMVLGIVGNLVVCYVFSCRLRKNTQHFLIVSLAVINLCDCLIVIPAEIYSLINFYLFTNLLTCRLLRFISVFCAFSSVLALVLIAVDRYLKVCYSMKRQICLFEAKMAVAGLVIICLMAAMPTVYVFGIISIDTDIPNIKGFRCSITESALKTKLPIIFVSLLLLAFFISFIALTFMYARIWQYMKRHKQYMTGIWFVSDQTEPFARESLITSMSELPQAESSVDRMENLKDIGREADARGDISNGSMSLCMQWPGSQSDKSSGSDQSSVSAGSGVVNMLLLLTSNTNNETGLQTTYLTPVSNAKNTPTDLRPTADIRAATSSLSTLWRSPMRTSRTIDSMNMAVSRSSRSSVLEINTYKMTVIAILVSFVFFLSFLPPLCLALAGMILGRLDMGMKGVSLFWFNICLRTYIINSVCNPIIYSVHNKRFRAEILKLVHECQICRKRL